MSSWSSRIGSWAAPGRWSPFSRTNNLSEEHTQISDADFSYITAEDVSNLPQSHSHSHSHSHAPQQQRHHVREADSLILRHKKISYPVHFSAHSIDDGRLRIGDLRESAAKKLDVRDARRIRMFYKGRNLKDDDRCCRDEGLRSDAQGEVLVVVGASVPGGPSEADDNDDDDASSSASDEYGDEDGDRTAPAAAAAAAPRKRRNRNRKKKSKRTVSGAAETGGGSTSSSSTARPSVGASSSGQTVEHLPVPSGTHPLHREHSSSSSQQGRSPRGPSSPSPSSASRSGPLDKLSSIASTFHTTLVPQCIQFTHSPPHDKAKREYEHKKLTETILAQVLLKLDAVETEGNDEARTRRKELVKEVQGMLNKLDQVVAAGSR